MSKIIEFPHYFSVYYEHVEEKEKYNFFGLLDIKQNRFYILHRNHALLKFLQLILLKNFYTFSIISFKHFNFSIHKNIDNHDCCNWGGTPDITETLELEVNTSIHGAELTNNGVDLLTSVDFELQKKMFFVIDILTKLDTLFKKIRDYEIDIKKPVYNGYDKLKTYLEIICPNDKNIADFIDKEQKQTQTKVLTLDSYQNKLFLFFYNIDFRKNSVESLLELFKKYIQTPEFELEHFRRVYQYPHNAYEELHKILGISSKY
jgi:hypothetical protein